jgi:hypothetical protein
VLWLFLLDTPFQVLLLSPVILWFTAAPQWRPEIIAGGAVFWGALCWLIWRRWRTAERQPAAAAPPEGDWRWPAGLPAADFATRLRFFLHNHGWREITLLPVTPEAITLTMRKDRSTILLRCLRTEAQPASADVESVAAILTEAKCSGACLAASRRGTADLHASALALNVRLITFADLAFIDNLAWDR